MGELRDQMEPENYLVRHGMSVLKAGMELNRCAGGHKKPAPRILLRGKSYTWSKYLRCPRGKDK